MTREVMQQALDALTYQGTMGPTRRQRRHAAIEALRAELDKPINCPRCYVGHHPGDEHVCKPNREPKNRDDLP